MIIITTDPLEKTLGRSVIIPTPIASPVKTLKFKTLKQYLSVISAYAKLTLKTKGYDKRMLLLNKKPHVPPTPLSISTYVITPNRLATVPKKEAVKWETVDKIVLLWTQMNQNRITNNEDTLQKIKNLFTTRLRNIVTPSFALTPLPFSGNKELESTIAVLTSIAVDVYLHVDKKDEARANKLVLKYNPVREVRTVWSVPRIKVPDTIPKRRKIKKVKSGRVR